MMGGYPKPRGQHIIRHLSIFIFPNLGYVTLNMRYQLVHEFKEGSDHWCEIRGFKKCPLIQVTKKSWWSELGSGWTPDSNGVRSWWRMKKQIADVRYTLMELGRERGEN